MEGSSREIYIFSFYKYCTICIYSYSFSFKVYYFSIQKNKDHKVKKIISHLYAKKHCWVSSHYPLELFVPPYMGEKYYQHQVWFPNLNFNILIIDYSPDELNLGYAHTLLLSNFNVLLFLQWFLEQKERCWRKW